MNPQIKKDIEEINLEDKFILDACCSGRAFWYNKKHPNCIYIDIIEENKGFCQGEKNFEVKPDIIMDFRDLKFDDKKFKLIVWDPPHLSTLSESSIFRKKFGCLNAETWSRDLKKGFNEIWRVLDDYGVMTFKWNDDEIKLEKLLKCFKERPLYGTVIKNKKNKTYWLCFMKIPEEAQHSSQV